METILKIEEVFDRETDMGGHCARCDGFVVRTDRQTIELLVENAHYCCETWGYFISEDDTSGFVGARLLDVRVTDEELLPGKVAEATADPVTSVMFIDLMTDRGVLQFTAYNAHNGHYGHMAVVRSEQVVRVDCL